MGAGRVAPAAEVCRALLARDHDPSVEGSARICLGHVLLAGGRPLDGLRELERAAGSPLLTTAERARAWAWAAYARLSLVDLEGASATARKACSTAPADPVATSVATAMSAIVSLVRGHLTKALEVINDAVRLADQSPGRQGHRFPIHAVRGFILIELDRLEEARATSAAGSRICEELGLGWHLPSYQMVRVSERFVTGEWDDAIAEVEASAGLADETGQALGLILGRSVLSLISLHRNDLSRAEEAAAAAMGQPVETGARYRTQWAVWARALILEADGKTADALETLAGCWDRCAQLGLTLEYRMLGADLVRLALACGDRGRARDAAAAVAELADENQEVPSLAGAALRCRGLAEDDAEILHAAVRAYGSAARPLELALASEDTGAAASLTSTERTVAGLVAEGLSNPRIGDRLYISRRTVQTHLAHVFAKLDITSRAQLAALVTQHRDGQPG